MPPKTTKGSQAKPEATAAPAGPPPASPDDTVMKPYWVGCDLEGPNHFYTIGGVNFPATTERVVAGDGIDGRIPQSGKVTFLTDAQVARIKRAAHGTVVRTLVRRRGSAQGRQQLMTASASRYRRNPRDYPVGRHLWLIEVSETFRPPTPQDVGAVPEERLISPDEAWVPPARELDAEEQALQRQAQVTGAAVAAALQG